MALGEGANRFRHGVREIAFVGGVFDDGDHQLVVVSDAGDALHHFEVRDPEGVAVGQRGQHGVEGVAVEYSPCVPEAKGVVEQGSTGAELAVTRVFEDLAFFIEDVEILRPEPFLLYATGGHIDSPLLPDGDAAAGPGDPSLLIEELAKFNDEVAWTQGAHGGSAFFWAGSQAGGWCGSCGTGRSWTAAFNTRVRAGAELAHAGAFSRGADDLADEVSERADKRGMGSDGAGAHHGDVVFITECLGLVIEIPHHLHVVGDKSDGRDDQPLGTDLRQRLDVIENVRLEPRNLGGTAPALIDQLPLADANLLRDEFGDLVELFFVVARLRHDDWDRVGGECDACLMADLREGALHPVGDGVHEAGVVEESAYEVDLRGVFDLRLGFEQGLTILTTTGVAAEGGCDDPDGPLDAVVAHTFEGFFEEGRCVAVGEVDGKALFPEGGFFEFSSQGGDEVSVLCVDGTLPAERIVVLCHGGEAFTGNVAPPDDVFEKWHHFIGGLGAAEREEHDGVIGRFVRGAAHGRSQFRVGDARLQVNGWETGEDEVLDSVLRSCSCATDCFCGTGQGSLI